MTVLVDTHATARELEELAAFSASPSPAMTRIVFSAPDMAARKWLKSRCRDAGLQVREDAVGNMFARWPGTSPELAPVSTGSHIDAIPNSGRYDGTVGVLGALEAIRSLKRAGFVPRRSIELILFTSEEPTRFGIGCLGSRLISGALSPERAAPLQGVDGQTLNQARQTAGFNGALESVPISQGHYHAFVELHIEQGPLLENQGIAIGVVTDIAAPASLRIALEGEGGHAGSVLMADRHDALVGAAEIVLAVEAAARSSGARDSVATTGVCNVSPGAVNSIPLLVNLEVDVRDTDLARRDAMVKTITEAGRNVSQNRALACTIEMLNADVPARCDAGVVEAITNACETTERLYLKLVSRAYHDTLFMSRIAPTGMIFIPCRAGVSHRPDEYASPNDIAAGTSVLAHTLGQLAS
jgi:N-carbamoyl-L-amino-acid hydrolase